MRTTFRGMHATEKPQCPDCKGFISDSKRHQSCPNCGKAVFILNGKVVDREPRPGTA